MADDETGNQPAALVMVIGASAPRQTLVRVAPQADFLSQLLAERHRLAPQRARRRASLGVAVNAYDNGARIAVRRMPAGYRTTIVT